MQTTGKQRIAFVAIIAVTTLLVEGCLWGRRGRYRGSAFRPGRALVVRPWVGAALVTAAVVGAAVAVASANAGLYTPQSCLHRTWYGGRWTYYCGDHWAYYEGGAWHAYPPSPPPQVAVDAPPPQVPPEAIQAPMPPPPPPVQ